MIAIRKVRHYSKAGIVVGVPPVVIKQLSINPGDDLVFEFQPGSKEITLTKSPYVKLPSRLWTKEEVELLRNLSKDGITKEVVARFDRTRQSVRLKARNLGLIVKKLKTLKPWSEDEVKLLIALYPTTSNPELVKRLGRSYGSVNHKANSLKLLRVKKRKSSVTRKSSSGVNVADGG